MGHASTSGPPGRACPARAGRGPVLGELGPSRRVRPRDRGVKGRQAALLGGARATSAREAFAQVAPPYRVTTRESLQDSPPFPPGFRTGPGVFKEVRAGESRRRPEICFPCEPQFGELRLGCGPERPPALTASSQTTPRRSRSQEAWSHRAPVGCVRAGPSPEFLFGPSGGLLRPPPGPGPARPGSKGSLALRS